MPKKYKLSLYSLTFHAARKTSQIHPTDNIEGSDAYKVFKTYFNNLSQQGMDGDNDSIYSFRGVDCLDARRSISGFVEYGESGAAGRGVNILTKKQTYIRQKDDADLSSFFFRLEFPTVKPLAILATTTVSGHGTIQLLKRLMREEARIRFPNTTVKMDAFVPGALIAALMDNGRVISVTAVQRNVRGDKTNYLGKNLTNQDEVNMRFTVSAANKGYFPSLLQLVKDTLANKKAALQVAMLPEGFDNPQDVMVTLETMYGEKSYSLMRQNLHDPGVDITDKLAYDPVTNHPLRTSLEQEAQELTTYFLGF